MATKFSRLQLDEPDSSSTRIIETITGSHRFKVEGCSFDWAPDIGHCIQSDIFIVGGYECVIKYYPDCSFTIDRLSFTLDIKSVGPLVKARVDFILLDHNGNPSTLSESKVGTFGESFLFSGKPLEYHVHRKAFEASDSIKNDSFTLVCTVTVVKRSHVESAKLKAVVVPPSNLDKHLSDLLETGEGSDVTFEVSGELYRVHKWLLAARSPVFRAQFFGSMNKNGKTHIKLNDIQPGVFRVLIHFIYSDSVPELEGDIEEDELNMYQHLLVAAERYKIERLKIICESKLAQNIEFKNFATILALAVKHECAQLKASCFEFVSSPKVLVNVMKTDGFERLTRCFPFILKELMENASNDK